MLSRQKICCLIKAFTRHSIDAFRGEKHIGYIMFHADIVRSLEEIFRYSSSNTGRFGDKVADRLEWGKSDPLKVLASWPQKPQRKEQNTNFFPVA